MSKNISRVKPDYSTYGLIIYREFNHELVLKPGYDFIFRTLLKYRFVPKDLFKSWISDWSDTENENNILDEMVYFGLIDLIQDDMDAFSHYVPSIGLKNICDKRFHDEFFLKKTIYNYVNIESVILEMNLYYKIYSGQDELINSILPRSYNPVKLFKDFNYPERENKEFLVFSQKDIGNSTNRHCKSVGTYV